MRRCRAADLRNLRQALCQRLNAYHQLGRGNRLALATGLVARQQAAAGIGRLQQHIDHGRHGRDFMAAQTVQQGFHAVRQLGHIRKAKGRGAALDGVGAAEDAIELLVIGRRQIQTQQHLLHLVQVLTGFLKEDLIELAEVKVCARACAVLLCVRHGVSCCY